MSLNMWWRQITLNYSPATIEFVGTAIVQAVSFWLPSAIFMSLPYIFPTFSENHKRQQPARQPTSAEIKDCMANTTRNLLIGQALYLAKLILGRLFERRTMFRLEATLPSFVEVVFGMAFGCLIREILYFYIHRAMHHPRIYRRVHKTHHRFSAPFGPAALYATATEHVFANILPVFLPPVLLHSHIVTAWAVVGLGISSSVTLHSGYDFLSYWTVMHDTHHELSTVYYGVWGPLDWLYGTNKPAKSKMG